MNESLVLLCMHLLLQLLNCLHFNPYFCLMTDKISKALDNTWILILEYTVSKTVASNSDGLLEAKDNNTNTSGSAQE